MKYSLLSLMIVVLVLPPLLAFLYFLISSSHWGINDVRDAVPILLCAGAALLIRIVLYRRQA